MANYIERCLLSLVQQSFKNIEISLQKNIEEWETERRKLILEEQEVLKTTKTFFEQSNQLLEFCKDCHRA